MPFANSSGIKWSHIYSYFGSGTGKNFSNNTPISRYYKRANANGKVVPLSSQYNGSFPEPGDPISFSDFTGASTCNSVNFTVTGGNVGGTLGNNGYRGFIEGNTGTCSPSGYTSSTGVSITVSQCIGRVNASAAPDIAVSLSTNNIAWNGNDHKNVWGIEIVDGADSAFTGNVPRSNTNPYSFNYDPAGDSDILFDDTSRNMIVWFIRN